MNKHRGAWLAKLIEAASGPAIAMLFWLLVILIALLSFAHGKFFEANFFEAFGAIGQVMFAAAVFWLGLQQFEFTKKMAERQNRIDTYGLRKELLDRFQMLYDIAQEPRNYASDEDFATAWYQLADEVSRVFVADIDTTIVSMAEALAELQEDSEFRRELGERFKGDMEGHQEFLKANWKKISDMRFHVWFMMHQELIIGDFNTNPGFDCSRVGQTWTQDTGWTKSA